MPLTNLATVGMGWVDGSSQILVCPFLTIRHKMMEMPCLSPGVGQLSTFHPAPPTTLSLSSSSSSSSGSAGPGSSSGGSSSGCGGSNPGLNARTPLTSIPPSTCTTGSGSSAAVLLQSGGSGMYQIHDGFATVRKRKGPTAASIAMRQQQECYDLAQPASAIVSAMASAPRLLPQNRNSVNHKRQGSFMQRLSSSKDKKTTSNGSSNGVNCPISGNNSTNIKKNTKITSSNGSASLLSTHPSLNLKTGHNNPLNSSKNGFSLIPVRKQSSSSTGSISPSTQQLLQQQDSLSHIQIQVGHLSPTPSQPSHSATSSFSGGHKSNGNRGNGLILKDYRRNSLATSTPWETSGSGDNNSFVFSCSESPNLDGKSDIHKTRLKPSPSTVSSSNNSSLGRRLRRLVLPNRMSMPSGKSGGFFEEEDGCGGSSGSNNLLMCKSPSASALSNENGAGNGVSCNGGVSRLRNSISDNSIVGSGSGSGNNNTPNQSSGSGHRGELCHSGHVRNFHRSCLLPKAPQLEPVMEDGIPWRQPKKDVPWWDMAIRKGRYRSCPILQVSQQVIVLDVTSHSLNFTWSLLENTKILKSQMNHGILQAAQ